MFACHCYIRFARLRTELNHSFENDAKRKTSSMKKQLKTSGKSILFVINDWGNTSVALENRQFHDQNVFNSILTRIHCVKLENVVSNDEN